MKRCLLFIVVTISSAWLLISCQQSNPSEKPSVTQEAQLSPVNGVSAPAEPGYDEGMYKVGSDLPPGEYVLKGDSAYFQVAKNSSGELSSIICNDNFNNRSIISLSNGQYITVHGARIIPIDKALKIEAKEGRLPEGMYKVGVDIPPGEYKVIANGSGYIEVSINSKHTIGSIVSNDNFENERYITVRRGQYIKLHSAELKIKQMAKHEEPKQNESESTEAAATGVSDQQLASVYNAMSFTDVVNRLGEPTKCAENYGSRTFCWQRAGNGGEILIIFDQNKRVSSIGGT
jgi:hypothetical protein